MPIHIGRRELIATIGAAAAWPLAARAQKASTSVIGFLNSESSGPYAGRLHAFREGLSQSGYVEGSNVSIEYRWADSQYDRLPELATDLVRHQVAVIVAAGSPAALAAKTTTTTIPIVFITGSDPVEIGLVASLGRPGGNMTGVAVLTSELGAKQLELLNELVPSATVIALLVNPNNPVFAETLSRELQAAGRVIRRQIRVVSAGTDRDLDTTFADLVQRGVGALVVSNDPFFNVRPDRLVALAARHALPAIYPYREFPAAGGLMSYGTNLHDGYHLVGVYTSRILKGEKPADLPVQRSTKVELVVNLKTAAALGVTFPITLLGRADEVIE